MSLPFRDIVFLSQRVPHPPDRGDRISTFHILRHFREQGARVRVGCFVEDDRDEQAVAELRGMVDEVAAPRIDPKWRKLHCLRGLATGRALTLPYFGHNELRAAVRRWTTSRRPDLVFHYSSSMGQYSMHLSETARVMHFAELDSDKWRQYAAKSGVLGRFVYGREARLLLEFERKIARSFDASLVVSDVERDLFLRCIPDVTPHVIPNGVDVAHFQSRGDSAREPHTVVFTGVMDYEPNVDGVLWFAQACWPAIRREYPDARFLVVGNRPIQRIRDLDGTDGIEVTGWVKETIPYFDRASVAIAPLRLARGIQNKVLEAMSMGLPVVASPQAAQGLGAVDANVLCVAPDEAAIIAGVLALFRDPAQARTRGARAGEHVRTHFRWEHMLSRLDGVLEQIARRRKAA
ncbi:MAG: TIGR03087 family PEP-CTERM/XrtA system glycosyltransferase [Planctomycetota bacterium]